MICPICRNENIEVKTFQEQAGSTQFQHTTSKYKEKGHGVVWWLFVGWWWLFVDITLWLCFFIPRLILKLFASGWKRKKYTGESISVGRTQNDIRYRTVCTCHNCGHHWTVD